MIVFVVVAMARRCNSIIICEVVTVLYGTKFDRKRPNNNTAYDYCLQFSCDQQSYNWQDMKSTQIVTNQLKLKIHQHSSRQSSTHSSLACFRFIQSQPSRHRLFK